MDAVRRAAFDSAAKAHASLAETKRRVSALERGLVVKRAKRENGEWNDWWGEASRKESAALHERVEEVRMELLRRYHLEEEAEKAERAEKARRDQEARQLEQARLAKEAEKAEAAKREREREQEKQREEYEREQKKVAEEKSQHRSSELVEKAMQSRKRYRERKREVAAFEKQFKKMVNGCRMMIQMTGETVKAMRTGYEGNLKTSGAGKFLSELQAKRAELMPLGMHVVAESILKFGTTNTAPDAIKSGETKFALVYLTVVLSMNFNGFYDIFMDVMCFHCPYAVPGLREEIVKVEGKDADRESLRSLLGYVPQESNADYIARMQAHIGFLAGVLQTSPKMLSLPPFSLVAPGSKHPCPTGGIVEAWRWIALTLNRKPTRWTPYLLQAFVAVAGFELSRRCGAQMKKIARLMASEHFMSACRAQGEFDLSKEDNDVDRMNTYTQFIRNVVDSHNCVFPAPGRDAQDVRELVLDVAQNQAD